MAGATDPGGVVRTGRRQRANHPQPGERPLGDSSAVVGPGPGRRSRSAGRGAATVRPARRSRRSGATCGGIVHRRLDSSAVVTPRRSGLRSTAARRGRARRDNAPDHAHGASRHRKDPPRPGRRRGRRPAGSANVVGTALGCRRVEVRARRRRRRPRRLRGHSRGDRHPIGRRSGAPGRRQPRAPRWRQWRAHRPPSACSRNDRSGDEPGTDRAIRRAGVAGSAAAGTGGRRGQRGGARVGFLGRAARRPRPPRHARLRLESEHRCGGGRGLSPSRRLSTGVGAGRRQLASARGPWCAGCDQCESARRA